MVARIEWQDQQGPELEESKRVMASVNMDHLVSLEALLGYLNFSQGKPDSGFQKQLNDAYAFLAAKRVAEPWVTLYQLLTAKLVSLKEDKEATAFQDVRQAEAVLSLVFTKALPAYRSHHRDLLAHLSDIDLYQPFFLARVIEAVLAQGPPWEEEERIIAGTLTQLNDFVGHRPVAILETRPRGEPYDHERVRPIPLFIRGAGVAYGRYHDLVVQALAILQAVDPAILADASFDPELLDELALDPRAYDQGHPAHRRPNYVFGEWDPHHIDQDGRYRRFVVRQVVLDALLDRVPKPGPVAFPSPLVGEGQGGGWQASLAQAESLYEAAAVLAGTILMASGISGRGPTAPDSSSTLSELMPRIAKYRDEFYAALLDRGADAEPEALARVGYHADASGSAPVSHPSEAHAARLRQEATVLRQPFGGARRDLNQFLTRHRAAQLQHRHLALLYADMGYPEASRRVAGRIPAVSMRMISEIWIRLATAQLRAEQGETAEAASSLADIEELIHRGIACGALVDPWNILGFQGMFPLSAAREDSIYDPRIDDLLVVMERCFDLYGRLLSEAAAAGNRSLVASLTVDLRRLASWWDRFASVEVQSVRRVHGGESVASAQHVAHSMAQWHDKGEAAGDLAFWRRYLEGFQSPKAFALVLEALLRKKDYRAAMALLMTWLNQVEQVPLEEGAYSFHAIALRWMLGVTDDEVRVAGAERSEAPDSGASKTPPRPPLAAEEEQTLPLVRKFFDYLEANAEDYWQVPQWEADGETMAGNEEEDSPYSAAYENVTYRDTADDDQEGAVVEGGPIPDVEWEAEMDRLGKRLRFLHTVAQLWQIAGWRLSGRINDADKEEVLASWLKAAQENQRRLLLLIDSIHDHPISGPMGSYESMVEYDRRGVMKEQLVMMTIGTCLASFMAAGALRGAVELPHPPPAAGKGSAGAAVREKEGAPVADAGTPAYPGSPPRGEGGAPAWEPLALRLEQALMHGDHQEARQALPPFIREFRKEPLIFPSLTEGGQPRQILRVQIAQMILRALLANLPRLGLLRETFHLLMTARDMEKSQTPEGRGITEFNFLFQAAYHGVVEAVVESTSSWPPAPGQSVFTSQFLIHAWHFSEEVRAQEMDSDTRLVEILEAITDPFGRLWLEHSRTVLMSPLEAIRTEEEWEALKTFVKRYGRDLFHARFMTLANLRGILHGGIDAYLEYLRENPDPLHPIQLLEEIDEQIPRADAVRHLQNILQTVVANYEEYKDYNATVAQSDYGENLHILLDFLRIKAKYERQAWQLRPRGIAHEVLVRKQLGEAAFLWRQNASLLTQRLGAELREELAQLEKAHGLRLATIADRVDEKFSKDLIFDRLCALIEPAMEGTEAGARAFEVVEKHLENLLAHPTGSGQEVPAWLRRLEQEVHLIRIRHSRNAPLVENFVQVPRVALSLEEIQRQVEEWESPLEPE